MGHGPVLVDVRGKPILPCLIWPDLRAMKQAAVLRSKVRELGIEKSVGSVMQGWYTAAKLLWISENYPDKFKRVHKVLLPKDYIQFKLTGKFATDHTDAAGTQLYDMNSHKWIMELLEFLGLSLDKLPDLCSMNEIAGEVSASTAEETGLAAGTKVMVGATDWGTFPVGLGALNPGDSFIYLGTSPGFGLCLDREIRSDALLEMGLVLQPYDSLPGRWLLGGALSVAGSSFTWYIEQFERATDREAIQDQRLFEKLEIEASQVKPGSEGLFFLPHLMGERCPENPNARAVLYGLSVGHTRAHIARSMYEGIAFSLRRIIDLVEERVGVEFKTFRAFGGGSKSKLMTQILADVLGKPILLPAEEEVGALGLALVAASILKHSRLEAVYERTNETAEEIEPQNELVRTYGRLYSLFRRIEEDMAPVYGRTAVLDSL